MNESILCVILTIWGVNLGISLAVTLFAGLVYFWSRGRIKTGSWITKTQKFKYGSIGAGVDDWDEAILTIALFDGIALFLISLFLTWFTGALGLTGYIVVSLILATVFLPRYFMDIVHTLRYSFKEKDSVRIAKLEAKLAKMESNK